ncbi:MAG: VOC family protein [Acidimicrobiia bacterium]
MMVSVDTVFLWVTDLESALDWFRRVGIDAGPRHGTWQVMKVDGGPTFALHEGSRPEGPPTAVVALRVDDLDAEMARLEGVGIRPVDDITDTGVSRFATYQDPDRNQIQLLERRT